MSAQWDFIEQAAQSLGIAAEALRKWRVRGVPGRYRLPITRLAESQAGGSRPKLLTSRRGRAAKAARLGGQTGRNPSTPTNRKQGGSTVTPEDSIRAREPRPFTGAEYIESLHDGREVYIDGERVADVTAHPAFRNSVRSLARLYDALHDPKTREVLTSPTDTGSGGYTHKYFRVARSREELVAQQRAIAEWSRLSYGWMGRTPDYKASLMNTLGANAEYYGQFAANARAWYRRAQENVLFMNHAIVNPPVDRGRPTTRSRTSMSRYSARPMPASSSRAPRWWRPRRRSPITTFSARMRRPRPPTPISRSCSSCRWTRPA